METPSPDSVLNLKTYWFASSFCFFICFWCSLRAGLRSSPGFKFLGAESEPQPASMLRSNVANESKVVERKKVLFIGLF